MSLNYNKLSLDLQNLIINDKKANWTNPFACSDDDALRRENNHDIPNIWRPPFVRDIEKILHLPLYNRYADKTQVFSLYSNDDISRRSLHVQLVSRISRNIGSVLGLNLDLIEAIALGHDIGHTPFGHAGEKYLNELFNKEIGKHFNHNVHSVRVLDTIYNRNITLQTLDGILCHNGEQEKQCYIPKEISDFDFFDRLVNKCISDGINEDINLDPATLEGCLVRICDMVAYLGKDRQDAQKAKITEIDKYSDNYLGNYNAQIINNLTVDIIENSYRKNYIAISDECYNALKQIKEENYSFIYKNDSVSKVLDEYVKPMFSDIFYKLSEDLIRNKEDSFIYKHHINFVIDNSKYYGQSDYLNSNVYEITVDFIASMTDDYFIKLYEFLFPDKKHGLEYKSYFSDI